MFYSILFSGFDKAEIERLRSLMVKRQHVLEKKAHKLAGHTFNLLSSKEVAQVKEKRFHLHIAKI